VQGEERLKTIADRVLRFATADQTEVLVEVEDGQLTRFAANEIHQNVSETNVTVRVRAVIDRQVGVAAGNDISEDGLRKVVDSAETVARFQQADPDFRSLPKPRPSRSANAYAEATAGCAPEVRARGVASILEPCRESGLEAAGVFSTGVQETMIVNSLGVNAYHARTVAHAMAVVMGEDSSGYAAETATNVDELDVEAVGSAAIEKAVRGRNPSEIAPGEYTVILEEDAVADMLFTLGYLGLGALAVQEGRSFLCNRFGERITGETITIWDDGLDPRGLVLPIDFEGMPKQRVMLIENGVARAAVYDSYTAGREPGKTNTGHALPSPNTFGPIPINLFLAPGDATKESMLADTKRGIWVTRFHYTNPVHPVKAILTGMTRDGTFLIENGEITRPLKNLRFTQGILEAFANADAIGSELKRVKFDWEALGSCAPAMRIDGFRFTGTTEF